MHFSDQTMWDKKGWRFSNFGWWTNTWCKDKGSSPIPIVQSDSRQSTRNQMMDEWANVDDPVFHRFSEEKLKIYQFPVLASSSTPSLPTTTLQLISSSTMYIIDPHEIKQWESFRCYVFWSARAAKLRCDDILKIKSFSRWFIDVNIWMSNLNLWKFFMSESRQLNCLIRWKKKIEKVLDKKKVSKWRKFSKIPLSSFSF